MGSATRQSRGCGCCGFFGCLGSLLLLIIIGVVAFFAIRITWTLYSAASDQALPQARMTTSQSAFLQARRKIVDFMQNPEIRSVSLSETEVNSMLAEAPELGFLQKGVSVQFRENEGEVVLRVPLGLVPFGRKYLNYEVFLRPIIGDEKVSVNVLRVTSAGKPLDPLAMRAFKEQAEPSLNQLLSGLNEIQQSHAIQSIQVQNGNVLLER